MVNTLINFNQAVSQHDGMGKVLELQYGCNNKKEKN